MKKKIMMSILAVLACLVIPLLGKNSAAQTDEPGTTPPPIGVIDWGTQEIRKSGIYTYQVIRESDKLATIRHINKEMETLTIPSELDGYKIIGVGQTEYIANALGDSVSVISHTNPGNTSLNVMGEYGQYNGKLKKIIFPEGFLFVGDYAFAGCSNLSSIDWPDRLTGIGHNAFVGCESLSHVRIPYGVKVGDSAFSDCGVLNKVTIESTDLGESIFAWTKIKKIVLPNGKEKNFNYSSFLARDIGIIEVGTQVKSLDLTNYESELTTDHDNDPSTNICKIGKIIVKGKNTKLTGWSKTTRLGSLYTVRNAKCISWAKKNKLTYQIKSCGKMGAVTKKGSRFSWKKVKTKVVKYTYKKASKKWKSTIQNKKTQYQVYGKKTKKGTYKLIKRTTKRSIKSNFKYVKVKPVISW